MFSGFGAPNGSFDVLAKNAGHTCSSPARREMPSSSAQASMKFMRGRFWRIDLVLFVEPAL
jgi:hypothetical protein